MADSKCINTEEQHIEVPDLHHLNIAASKSSIKNFKEDEHKNSTVIASKFNSESNDMRSEISDGNGKRIDLDGEDDNYFDYHNKAKKDPQNKEFNFFYEIQFYGSHDFIFDFKGEMSKIEFTEKTLKIRSYPYHLKYTLFSSDEIKNLRQKEFAFLNFHFDEYKSKGNKMYKRANFREAVNFYIMAYSLLKWIEFKDSQNKNYTNLLREQTPILDDDIILDKCAILNGMTNAIEEDSYRFCLINLLMSMSYAYMEIRHYRSAIDCLNECVSFDDSVADVYFRRSQARMYDNFSDISELYFALADVQRAMTLGNCEVYKRHCSMLANLIRNKKLQEKEKIKSKKNIKNLILKSGFIIEGYNSYTKHKSAMKLILEQSSSIIYQNTQYKVLKE